MRDASEDATLSGKGGSVSRSSSTGSTKTFDQGTESSITEKDDGDTSAVDEDVSMITEKRSLELIGFLDSSHLLVTLLTSSEIYAFKRLVA